MHSNKELSPVDSLNLPKDVDFFLKLVIVCIFVALIAHTSILIPHLYQKEIRENLNTINYLEEEIKLLRQEVLLLDQVIYEIHLDRQEYFHKFQYLSDVLSGSDSYFAINTRSFMLLVNIIDGEAGEIATHEERLCVGQAALNRCQGEFNNLYECLTSQGRHQFRPRFFNRFNVPRYTSSYWTAYLLAMGYGLEECNSVTHFFSPRSMPRGVPPLYPVSLIESGTYPQQDTIVGHYRDPYASCRSPHPSIGCIYSFSTRHGFQYFFSISGETRNYGSLNDVHIPNFANSNLYLCHSNIHRNIRPEYFVFCERNL